MLGGVDPESEPSSVDSVSEPSIVVPDSVSEVDVSSKSVISPGEVYTCISWLADDTKGGVVARWWATARACSSAASAGVSGAASSWAMVSGGRWDDGQSSGPDPAVPNGVGEMLAAWSC